jgi:hypothetical protein
LASMMCMSTATPSSPPGCLAPSQVRGTPPPTPMSLGVVPISYAQVSSPPPWPLTVPSLRVGEPDASAIARGRTSN